MDGINIKFVSVHDVNVAMESAARKDKLNEEFMKLFISNIFKRRLNAKNPKKFQVRDVNTEVISNVLAIAGEKKPDDSNGRIDDIANHLFKVEWEVTQKYAKEKDQEDSKPFITLEKGILVQSLLEYGDKGYYLLAKVDSDQFLDKEDWEVHTGFSYEKHVFKSCLIKFKEESSIEEILLYDSNGPIAAYWSDGFLELNKINSGKENTKNAMKAIEEELDKSMKKKYPDDLQQIKEEIREHMEKSAAFKIEDISLVLKNHHPSDKTLPKAKLISNIQKLPVKKKFDEDFDIDIDTVTSKKERVIPLSARIELVLKCSVHNLTVYDICLEVNPLNEKYLKIKVDDEYGLPGFMKCPGM